MRRTRYLYILLTITITLALFLFNQKRKDRTQIANTAENIRKPSAIGSWFSGRSPEEPVEKSESTQSSSTTLLEQPIKHTFVSRTEPAADTPNPREDIDTIQARSDALRAEAIEKRSRDFGRITVVAGTELDQAGKKYQFVTNVRAASRRASIPVGAQILEERSGTVFYFSSPDQPRGAGSLPVVYDRESSSVFALTGNVEVRWNASSSLGSLPQDFRLKPLQSFDDLQTAFFRADRETPQELAALVTSLKGDSRVADAKLELLRGTRSPH